MLEKLIALGLSKDEAQVYLAMLELGGGFVSQIAKRSGKQRATCYHTLSNIVARGLASKMEKGKYQFFSPEPPERLVQQSLQRLESAKTLLPELLSVQNTLARKPKIKFFEGIDGIEAIFEDTLSAEGEILGYTNIALMLKLFPDFFKKYTKRKIEKNIKTRYLSPQTNQNLDSVSTLIPSQLALDYFEMLFINPEQFPFENEIAIYSSKVAIMSLSEKEKLGILIESHTISKTMKAVFDLSWLGATAFIAE